MTDPSVWRLAPAPYAAVQAMVAELGVSEVTAQVLVRRGFADAAAARAFLRPEYLVHDPYLMAGMEQARHRLDLALSRGEPIAVYGDYDADGITATFLLVSVLEQLGADVRWRLPSRFTEGYGVSVAAVEEVADDGVGLLVTVDCGIGARAEVARAAALGVDVIVTDHHEIEGPLPDCVVVTPKLPGYPFAHLAGVGVAFKLAHALLEERRSERVEVPLALRELTDLVAIGTIADVVPLHDENRVLASIGLGRLNSAPRPGLAALMEVAGIRAGGVTAGAVGFRVAPRLNAAGRLEDASLALELLGCVDRSTALPPALRLNELNRERQAIEAGMLDAAGEMVPDPLPPALVLSSPEWHEGVLGIVASRVVERFNRPTILLSEGAEEAKGSGRSIASFDLLAAVQRSAGPLLAYGGHRHACGLRLRRERIAEFREAFVTEAAAALTDDDFARTRHIDAVVAGDELTLRLADELEQFAPHGFGNPKVGLLLHAAEVVDPRPTRNGDHLRYRVRCDGSACQAIHFRGGHGGGGATGRHDLRLALSKTEFNGSVSAQVEVLGLRRLDVPETDLCATACDRSCTDRLLGEQLWRALLHGPGWLTPGAEDAAAVEQARADGRLVDVRRRPVVSRLAALAGTGEKLVALAADVARRRPLLARDVLSPQLDRRGVYVQAACATRVSRAAEADVVLTSYDLAAACPDVLADARHVVLLDPPFTRAVLEVVAAATPHAWLHALWGPREAAFAEKVAASQLDLDAALRYAWRVLDAGPGRFDDALALELLDGDPFLRSAGALAAALRAFCEAGLLFPDEAGGYHLERPQSKVDVTRTATYQAWHTLFRTSRFLRNCPTAAL